MRRLHHLTKGGNALSRSTAALFVFFMGAIIGMSTYAVHIVGIALSTQQRTMARNQDILSAVGSAITNRIPKAHADIPGSGCASCTSGSGCGGGGSCSSCGCGASGCGNGCTGGGGGCNGCDGCASSCASAGGGCSCACAGDGGACAGGCGCGCGCGGGCGGCG